MSHMQDMNRETLICEICNLHFTKKVINRFENTNSYLIRKNSGVWSRDYGP